MYKVKLRLKCRKHPRFDPVKQGMAAVKGGCEVCIWLITVSKEIRAIQDKFDSFYAIRGAK